MFVTPARPSRASCPAGNTCHPRSGGSLRNGQDDRVRRRGPARPRARDEHLAKEIELEDPWEKIGAELVKEVAKKTDDVAGDGTTTATVLAQALVREGLRNVAAGANPMALKRGIEKAVEAVTSKLLETAKDVETKEQIAQTAGISAG